MARSEADDIFDSASADDIFDAAPSESIPEAPPVAQPVEDGPGAFDPKSNSGAALRGFGQGASLGFADELGGAGMAGIAGLADIGARVAGYSDADRDELRYKLTGVQPRETGGKGVDGSAYQAVRDSMRRDDKTAAAESPWLYGGAALAGGLTTPAPAAKGIKMLGGVLKPFAGRALVGAGIGGVSGAGMSEGETAGAVVKDTIRGADFGAASAPMAGAVGDKLGGSFSRWLEQRSRVNAGKAIGNEGGISNKAARLGYTNEDDLLAMFAKVRDEGDIITPFGTPSGAAKRIENALQESSNAKSAANVELDSMLTDLGEQFNFNKLAQRADDAVRPDFGWDPLSRENAKGAMEMAGKASASQGGFGMAEQVRRSMGKSIPWNAPAFAKALPEEIANMRQVYGMTADEIGQQARDVESRYLLKQGKVPTPDDLGASNQVAAMNKRISTLIDAQALANEQATREASRGSFGLKDIMAGSSITGGALASGQNPLMSVLGGAAVAGASHLARNRLPSAMTYPQHAAAQALPGAMRTLEGPAIKALTSTTSPVAVQNAYDALMQRFGISAKSKEQLADEAFLKGQSDPSMQSGR